MSKKNKDILDNFYELPEADDDGIAGVEGTLETLYAPGSGQYPKQNAKIVDEEGNEQWIVFSNSAIFLDNDEWEGRYVKIESKWNDKYSKWTGVKVKETDKGDNLWVTATAKIYDEDGDLISTGDPDAQTRDSGRRSSKGGSSGRAKKSQEERGRRSSKSTRKTERSSSKGSTKDGEAVDVYQLTEDICNVTIRAFNFYCNKLDIDEELHRETIAATLASGHGSAIAHWWFGSDPDKYPTRIEELRETKKKTRKPNRQEQFDEDEEDDIPF